MDKQNNQPQSIQQIKKQWVGLSTVYHKFDCVSSSFYFTLVNMIKLHQAKNILEVGAGNCTLVPQVLQLKKKQTNYRATDLSEDMVAVAKKKLQNHFQRYESKITFQQWMQENNLTIQVANGEQPLNSEIKYDRMIACQVLMITTDPQKMLTNLYNSAQNGCLLAVAIWGDKTINTMQTIISEAVEAAGIPPGNTRSNFHLYRKLEDLAGKVGWKTKFCWQQLSSFPYLEFQGALDEYITFVVNRMKHPQDKKSQIYQYLKKRFNRILKQDGRALVFPAEMYILIK